MEKSNKIGSEITVRISLAFQDAPDVHTLLAMTPVRERGKLVRLALERYIAATGHPAGNVDAQIAAVSAWLRSRSSTPTADFISSGDLSPMGELQSNTNLKGPIDPALHADISSQSHNAEHGTGHGGSMTTTASECDSPSMRRWLRA